MLQQYEEKECNRRLVKEVSEELEQTQAYTEKILSHYSQFIANTIRSGSLEGVFIPFLGKIQPKLKNQQYRDYLHSLHPVFKKVLQTSSPDMVEKIFEE
jgi:type II secretory pathway component PulF